MMISGDRIDHGHAVSWMKMTELYSPMARKRHREPVSIGMRCAAGFHWLVKSAAAWHPARWPLLPVLFGVFQHRLHGAHPQRRQRSVHHHACRRERQLDAHGSRYRPPAIARQQRSSQRDTGDGRQRKTASPIQRIDDLLKP
jgi:hypothetical protein